MTVPLLTVQTDDGDVVEIETGRPDVAVPDTLNGGERTVFAGIVAKVIVCPIFWTVTERVTCGAALKLVLPA